MLRARIRRASTRSALPLLLAAVVLVAGRCPFGLAPSAYVELASVGVNKYLGEFEPVATREVGDGWVEHRFDPDGGNGPICIAGTPYSVYTRAGNPSKLLIFAQGGGACWQGFYNCNVLAEDQAPPGPRAGIWDFDRKDNPFRKYSIVYMPYCDGSVFSGDNDVVDPSFPFGPVRYHRGLRNQSAAMDVAKRVFPHARRITVAGSSAGGVGVAGFTSALVRFRYGNTVKVTIFNDAGPVTVNTNAVDDIQARARDWQFAQFYPPSCTECDPFGQAATAVIRWRLDHDRSVREAFYETDGDIVNRFFLRLIFDPAGFRSLLLAEHDAIHAAHPDRYKRFIVAGDLSHTALQSDLFYTQEIDGIPLNEWTADFLKDRPSWVDLVEDPVVP